MQLIVNDKELEQVGGDRENKENVWNRSDYQGLC